MIVLLALLLHGDSVSSARIEVSGREAVVTFTFSMEDLAELARLDLDRNGTVEPEEWRQVLPAIFSYLADRFRIDGCRGEGDLQTLPPATPRRASVALRMRYVSPDPLDRLHIRCTLFHQHEGNPRHILEAPAGRVIVFDRERPESDLDPSPTVRMGMLVPVGVAAAVIAIALMSRA
jgi:hypothetical protein